MNIAIIDADIIGRKQHRFPNLACREFAMCRGMTKDGYRKFKRDTAAYLQSGGRKGSEWRSMERAAEEWPELAARYFDVTPEDIWRCEA